MVYLGYYRYDGIELANEARLVAYVENMRLDFYKCDAECPVLIDALFDRGWASEFDYELPDSSAPQGETAPWYDPAAPISANFAGVAILDATGMEATTYSTSVDQLAVDGGYVHPGRRSSREMVFRALLIGTNAAACSYGLTWLTTTLIGGDVCRPVPPLYSTYKDLDDLNLQFYKKAGAPTGDNVFQLNWIAGVATGETAEQGNTYRNLGLETIPLMSGDTTVVLDSDLLQFRQCAGKKLDFLKYCAMELDDNGNTVLSPRSWRHMVDVHLLEGPRILSSHSMPDADGCSQGAWIEVEFTLVAGNPGIWHDPASLLDLVSDFTYRMVQDPVNGWLYYAGGDPLPIDDDWLDSPIAAGQPQTYEGLFAVFAGEATSLDPQAGFPEVPPAPAEPPVIYDPMCGTLPAFPDFPQQGISCGADVNTEFSKLRFQITTESLYKYLPLATIVDIQTGSQEVRDIRVYVFPDRYLSPTEYIISYIPASAHLVVDSQMKRSDVATTSMLYSGQWSSANHLIGSGSQGYAFTYEEVVCPGQTFVEIDIPSQYDVSQIRVNLQAVHRDL